MALSQSNVIEKMVFPITFVMVRSEATRQSKPVIPNKIAMPHLFARNIIRRIRCIQKI